MSIEYIRAKKTSGEWFPWHFILKRKGTHIQLACRGDWLNLKDVDNSRIKYELTINPPAVICSECESLFEVKMKIAIYSKA
jgi:hypothetical protein